MIAEAREKFLRDYLRIRQAEGRGSDRAEYYLALPYQDLSGRHADQWAIRGRTYRYFEQHVLPEFEREAGGRLRILDLGAGTGWMSYRLSLRGHEVTPVDLLRDTRDGLDAAFHYAEALGRQLDCVEADFDDLPFASGAFDLGIFNASIHYSSDYRQTLGELRRCLKPGGSIAILDSPVYKRREHGEAMRRERHADFEKTYGFASDHAASIEYFDLPMLDQLSAALDLDWRIHRPWYGWGWHLRPLRAKLRGARPPSRFCILLGKLRTR
jgi:SAM-dependent methyltransferase